MNILVAVDASPYSQDAVDEVAFSSVIQPYTPPVTEFALAGATLDEIRRQQTAEAERLTSRAADLLGKSNIVVETGVHEGDPRSVIVDQAREWNADLIVLGSHGHAGLKRLLVGSVAQAVVGHAPCSVEVVRRRERH